MKQNYGKEIITSLFQEYFPEKDIIDCTLCEVGIENSNFLLETEDKKYILKVFENSKNEEDAVRTEIAVMIELKRMGSNVPILFQSSKGGDVIIPGPEGKPTVLMEYIESDQFYNTPLTSDIFFRLGKSVAEFQKTLSLLDMKYMVSEANFFDLKYIFEQKEFRSIKPEYADPALLETVWKDLAEIEKDFLLLPCQIIHNDLNNSNILYSNNEPYFIDFSDISQGSCIQDIAIFLTSFCFRLQWLPGGMTDFLRGYQTILPLTTIEKKCLFACIEARFLNILMIPYFESDLGDDEKMKTYILENYEWLKRFHAFGKENFIKYIP